MIAFIIPIVLVLTFGFVSCEPARNKASDIFWGAISAQFEREEAERQRKYDNHEVVIGRDTVAVFGKHYEIGKTYDLNGKRIDHLYVVVEDADGVILSGVTHRDRKSGQYYVISEEGYAVIDKNDYCRVYITVPKVDFERGYKENPDGTTTYYTGYIESKYIEYLDSYEEFSEKERKFFEKMQKK